MKIIIIIIFSILFLSCKKELNINQFTEDFQHYESEVRIEGIILPNYETAIVRIDKSFPLSDTNLYDCRDNDYGRISEAACYALNGVWHGIVGSGDLADCGDWNKDFDDLGTDAKPLDSTDEDEDNNVNEFSQGEGNGIPDCGEPNVDEINEVISRVHINEGCIVKVKHNNEECQLFFSENADSFFTEKKYIPSSPIAGKVLNDTNVDYYGAYIPNSCNSFNWNDYGGEYTFFCDCTEAGYGIIRSKESIRLPRPVIFIKVEDSTNIKQCMDYDCLLMNSSIISENVDSLFFGMNTVDKHIYYTTLKENITDFEHVQYMFDEYRNNYIYFHGHKARTTSNNIFNSIVLINREKIITRLYDGQGNDEYDLGEMFADTNNNNEWEVGEYYRDGPDGEGDVNRFFYEIISFSKSYRDYYFLSDLDLSDPVRSNLRDSNNNPIMGAFGALATNRIYFRLVDCDMLLNENECVNKSGGACTWNIPNLRCINSED